MMDRILSPLPMQVQHFEKGMHYSDAELVLLAKKVGRLATYCKRLKDEASFIRVEAERRETKKARDSVKVMLTVELPRKTLRAESRRERLLDAVDRCVEKVEPQLKRYKELHMPVGQLRKALRRTRRQPVLKPTRRQSPERLAA